MSDWQWLMMLIGVLVGFNVVVNKMDEIIRILKQIRERT